MKKTKCLTQTVEVEVEVELDASELSTQELIDALGCRKLNLAQCRELMQQLSQHDSTVAVVLPAASLADVMKLEVLKEAVQQYSYTDLLNRLR